MTLGLNMLAAMYLAGLVAVGQFMRTINTLKRYGFSPYDIVRMLRHEGTETNG